MDVKEIYIFSKYYKNMLLCGNKREKIYKCDNFAIILENNIIINAIGFISKADGFYFEILSIKNNNKIYRSPRYYLKYLCTVRDSIFEYYRKNGGIPWEKNK